ncbi:MAG: helix-turn-helix domain-containing protein, partial [Lachnospiraceae bacterium]|nr:helix-turn-helix domain-containing protein [Lachnospiraceae bacterium]
MKLISLTPFIRFADILRFTRKRGPSRTYDSRMLYCLSGRAKFDIDGKHYVLTHGTFVLFQPGPRYVIQPDPDVTLAVFDFDYTDEFRDHTAFLVPCPAASYEPGKKHPVIFVEDVPALSEALVLPNASVLEPLIRKIISEFREKRVRFREIASSCFKELISELTRNLETGRDEKNVTDRILAYVEDHLGEAITNEAIGKELFYNPNYLNRVLLQKTGMTLHQYVLERRLQSAKTLLFTTDRPIGDIAA